MSDLTQFIQDTLSDMAEDSYSACLLFNQPISGENSNLENVIGLNDIQIEEETLSKI